MNPPAAKLLVLTGNGFACIRIIGRANFSSSIDFRTLVNELQAKGLKYFLIELSECALMDSTFLGVLAGFGLKMGGPQPVEEDKAIELVNPNPRIEELLESLGVLHLFKVSKGVTELCAGKEHIPQVPGSASREELTRCSLEAHQILMEINPGNVAKFKDVARFLQEDLKKLQGQ
jgi:anti-anti-sigma regulatory factor